MSNSSFPLGARCHRRGLGLVFLVTMIFATKSNAQSTYTSDQLQAHFQRTAESYVIEAEGKPIILREKPLMNWLNNERQQDRGALYVWEREGQPLVLASIFSYEYNSTVYCRHEMISLAEGPLLAKIDSQLAWSPRKTAMDWRTLDSSISPANTANRRLIEMRSIAKQFSGQLLIPGKQPSKLVLIPQPLHRYQAPTRGVMEGAIFSLAVGTDPEILLVIEAIGSEGKSSYRYAPLRSHYHELQLERDGEVVWKAPMEIALESTVAGENPHCHQPFFVFNPFTPLPPPEDLK